MSSLISSKWLRYLIVLMDVVVLVVSGDFSFAKGKKVQGKVAKGSKKLTAEQIIAAMDSNMVFETRRALATMKIHKRGRTRLKKMLIYSKGERDSYTEFLYPARDKGVKYLRLGDNLWMYLPSAEKVIKIAGHMLRQSMMGSDFSYEDMLDATSVRKRYRSKLVGEERFAGHDCYVIIMTQKKAGETYPKRKVWIAKNIFVPLRYELFAASGRLLKVMVLSNIRSYGKRHYPTKIRMMNKLRRGTWTEFEMTEIRFKVKLPEEVFSLRNLQRE